MIEIRKNTDRGVSKLDWLDSKHTFSFSNYYDSEQVGFSDLLVINEDYVKAGKGFGTHPHRDMEIYSYVLEGALAHQDSMGNGSTIYPGDVQMMSAGTGVFHSEKNPLADQDVHFLQIWIVPNKKGVQPRYQQTHFSDEEKRGKFRLLISPQGEQGSLSVYQDIRVYCGLFDGQERATLQLEANRYAYIHVAKGSVNVNGHQLEAGDGARVRDLQELNFSDGIHAEVLVFDMRPNERPM
ncbi:MAG: pirin family protein [Saezia sp.]